MSLNKLFTFAGQEFLDFIKENYISLAVGSVVTSVFALFTMKYKVYTTKKQLFNKFIKDERVELPKNYIPREIELQLFDFIWSRSNKVPILYGPSGSGKSTILKSIFNKSKKQERKIQYFYSDMGILVHNFYETFSLNPSIVGRPPKFADFLFFWMGTPIGLVKPEDEKERFYYLRYILSDLLGRSELYKEEIKVILFENFSSLLNHELIEEFIYFTHFLSEQRNVKVIFNCDNQESFEFLMKRSRERYEPYLIGDLTEKEFELFLAKTKNLKNLSKDELKKVIDVLGLNVSNLERVDCLLVYNSFDSISEKLNKGK